MNNLAASLLLSILLVLPALGQTRGGSGLDRGVDPDGNVSAALESARRGDTAGAVGSLRAALNPETPSLLSRAGLLVHQEFWGLTSNPEFMALMSETREQYDARMAARHRRAESRTVSLEATLAAAATYAEVHDVDTSEALERRLIAADDVVRPGLKPHARALVDLMRRDTTDYLRLILGSMLLDLHDPDITREVAQIVKDDDFRRFPNQLFWLAHAMASRYPEGVLPLIRQMLGLKEGYVYLAAHSLQLRLPEMLLQVCAAAEPALGDELVTAARSPDSLMASNALTVLCRLMDPRAVSVLAGRVRSENDGPERAKLALRIVGLVAPVAFDTLRQLYAEGLVPDSIGVMIDSMERTVRAQIVRNAEVRAVPPAIRRLILQNLAASYGSDVSTLPRWIFDSMERSDIPDLIRVRAAAMARLSDEAIHDYWTITRTILTLAWRES